MTEGENIRETDRFWHTGKNPAMRQIPLYRTPVLPWSYDSGRFMADRFHLRAVSIFKKDPQASLFHRVGVPYPLPRYPQRGSQSRPHPLYRPWGYSNQPSSVKEARGSALICSHEMWVFRRDFLVSSTQVHCRILCSLLFLPKLGGRPHPLV